MNEDIDIDNSVRQRPARKEIKSSCDTWERWKFKFHSLSSFLKIKDGQDMAWPHFPARVLFQAP